MPIVEEKIRSAGVNFGIPNSEYLLRVDAATGEALSCYNQDTDTEYIDGGGGESGYEIVRQTWTPAEDINSPVITIENPREDTPAIIMARANIDDFSTVDNNTMAFLTIIDLQKATTAGDLSFSGLRPMRAVKLTTYKSSSNFNGSYNSLTDVVFPTEVTNNSVTLNPANSLRLWKAGVEHEIILLYK